MVYKNFTLAANTMKNTSNGISFGSFRYKGTFFSPYVSESECGDWDNYISSVSLPFETLYFSKVSASFQTSYIGSNNNNAIEKTTTSHFTCTDQSIVGEITAALLSIGSLSLQKKCQGNDWNFFYCESAGSVVVAINKNLTSSNCNTDAVCSGSGGNTVLNPCRPCLEKFATYGAINFEYSKKILYPQLSLPFYRVNITRNSISVQVNSSKAGTVYW